MNKAFCPNCAKEVEMTVNNQYRPFCSKRCRLIDLGEWISESYSITDANTEDHIEIKPIQKH